MTDYLNNISAKLEIIKASEIIPKEVRWLWYPYIPFGKVTLLQGDPGDGKNKLMLSLAALLSKGDSLPFADEEEYTGPMTVIYQTTEDDADDTVVPRFNSAGGDGERLIFIKEDEKSLTFGDDRIRCKFVNEIQKKSRFSKCNLSLRSKNGLFMVFLIFPCFFGFYQLTLIFWISFTNLQRSILLGLSVFSFKVCSAKEFFLKLHEQLSWNDCFVVILNIVMWNNAVVGYSFLSKNINRIGLLQKGITNFYFLLYFIL